MAKKPEVPLVFLTSLESVDERARFLDAGADDVVPKSFAFAELAARIRAVLRRGSHATCAFEANKSAPENRGAVVCVPSMFSN